MIFLSTYCNLFGKTEKVLFFLQRFQVAQQKFEPLTFRIHIRYAATETDQPILGLRWLKKLLFN